MMPQKTLSLKGAMAEALWNSNIIWNPRCLREKKELNCDMVKWIEKRLSAQIKSIYPPKYLHWGGGGCWRAQCHQWWCKSVFSFIERGLIYVTLSLKPVPMPLTLSGCHRKILEVSGDNLTSTSSPDVSGCWVICLYYSNYEFFTF